MGISKDCHDHLISWVNSMLPKIGRDMFLKEIDNVIYNIPQCARNVSVREFVQWYEMARRNGNIK